MLQFFLKLLIVTRILFNVKSQSIEATSKIYVYNINIFTITNVGREDTPNIDVCYVKSIFGMYFRL